MSWKLNYNAGGTLISDEQITASTSPQNLAHDNFFDVEVWTGANKTGTKLAQNVDFFLDNFDSIYQGYNTIYFSATYDGATVYVTYYSKGDYVDASDLNYLYDNKSDISWVNSQLSGKSDVGHFHSVSDITDINSYYYSMTDLQTPGLAQVNWGNITNKPSVYPPDSHTHSITDIVDINSASVNYAVSSGNSDTVDGKHASDFANATHTHVKADIIDFSHTHNISEVTNLQSTLDNKSDVGHTHVKTDITDFAHNHTISEITDISSASVNYATSSGNADKLDNLDSSQFVRSDVDDTVYGKLTINNSIAIGSGIPYYKSSITDAPVKLPVIYIRQRGYFDAIKALTGEGDYFYCVDRNPDYTVTSNYSGWENLFNGNMASNIYVPINNLSTNPWELEIKKNSGTITATDVLTLILTGHRLGSYGTTFTSWKVETIQSDGSYLTVLDRDGVSDEIDMIYVPLHIGSGYDYIKGIRLTVRGATSATFRTDEAAISSLQLRDFRPSMTPAQGLGALDIRGGDMFGDVNWRYGTPKVSGNDVWHAGNDGSGSGLDADMVDGKHAGNASGNIPINNGTLNTNLNADLLDGKHASDFANAVHSHVKADITDFSHTHVKSEITDFIHTHTRSEITDFSHTHDISDINNLQSSLDGKSNVGHTHLKSDITDFSHTHSIADITNLQTTLDGKASTTHTHSLNNLTDVTVSTPSSGQVVRYNGTTWVNASVSWSDIAGKPSTFTPSAHTHAASDITNLSSASVGYATTSGNSDTVDGLHASSFIRRDASTSPTADNTFSCGSASYRWANVYAVNFQGTATTAKYADLAEKYTSPKMPIGTVVEVSTEDEYEVVPCNRERSPFVIGVVSENPAFLMNSDGEGIPIALTGKVKVRIIGKIKKGDPIISAGNGVARAIKKDEVLIYHIGFALESSDDEKEKLITCIIK